MGKGTIISELGSGKYNVQINYNKDRYNYIVSLIDKNILSIEDKINTLTPGTTEYSLANLEKTALEKKKEYIINNFPDDETIEMWCVDLSLGVTGEVPTIEIPGESTNIQLAPHFDGPVYSGASDGQLMPTISMTPEQAFYNLAILPGWQKWKPTYRYGNIISIDTVENKCDVNLETTLSSQQDLDVNQSTALSDVVFDYMDCDHLAFSVGDDIVVKFVGQNWDNPVVVGFKTDPKSCSRRLVVVYGDQEEYLDITGIDEGTPFEVETVTCTDTGYGSITYPTLTRLYGDFTMCFSGVVTGDTSGASATVTSAIEGYYKRLYNAKLPSGLAYTGASSLIGPLDNSPMSEYAADGYGSTGKEWTKTYYDLSVSVFVFHTTTPGLGTDVWDATAMYKGRKVTWPSGVFQAGFYFARSVCTQATCTTADAWTETFVGFDIWDEYEPESEEIRIFASFISDQEETLYVYMLDEVNAAFELVSSIPSSVRSDKFDPAYNPERHVRLIGLDERTVFWCDMERSGTYYEESLSTLTITEHVESSSGYIVGAVWDHINKQLHFATSDVAETGDEHYSNTTTSLSNEIFYKYGVPISQGYYTYGYYTYHEAEHCSTFDYELSDGEIITIWHGKRTEGGPGSDVWSGALTDVEREYTADTDYGNFTIDGSTYDKGTYRIGSQSTGVISTEEYGGLCVGSLPAVTESWDTVPLEEYNGLAQYSLTGLFVDVNGSVSATYETRTADSEGNFGDWSSETYGSKSESASGFPHDAGWNAILLEGQDFVSIGEITPYGAAMVRIDIASDEKTSEGSIIYSFGAIDRVFYIQL